MCVGEPSSVVGSDTYQYCETIPLHPLPPRWMLIIIQLLISLLDIMDGCSKEERIDISVDGNKSAFPRILPFQHAFIPLTHDGFCLFLFCALCVCVSVRLCLVHFGWVALQILCAECCNHTPFPQITHTNNCFVSY